MNNQHMNFRCKNVEAYNKFIETIPEVLKDDVDTNGLKIYVGHGQHLDWDKLEQLDQKDYVVFCRDDMMNPGWMAIGNRFFLETQSAIEEAMGGEKYRDEWKEKETDKIFSRKEINEIIEDYTKDWEI